MIVALLIIVIVVAAIAATTWTVRSLLRYSCPDCGEENSSIIPAVPGLRWYCLACEKMFDTDELIDKNDKNIE